MREEVRSSVDVQMAGAGWEAGRARHCKRRPPAKQGTQRANNPDLDGSGSLRNGGLNVGGLSIRGSLGSGGGVLDRLAEDGRLLDGSDGGGCLNGGGGSDGDGGLSRSRHYGRARRGVRVGRLVVGGQEEEREKGGRKGEKVDGGWRAEGMERASRHKGRGGPGGAGRAALEGFRGRGAGGSCLDFASSLSMTPLFSSSSRTQGRLGPCTPSVPAAPWRKVPSAPIADSHRVAPARPGITCQWLARSCLLSRHPARAADVGQLQAAARPSRAAGWLLPPLLSRTPGFLPPSERGCAPRAFPQRPDARDTAKAEAAGAGNGDVARSQRTWPPSSPVEACGGRGKCRTSRSPKRSQQGGIKRLQDRRQIPSEDGEKTAEVNMQHQMWRNEMLQGPIELLQVLPFTHHREESLPPPQQAQSSTEWTHPGWSLPTSPCLVHSRSALVR